VAIRRSRTFAQDPERLARFEREARLLASLNHPNVAGIHGLEEVAGHRYLVLEFVEGETLAARLAHGPIPVDEALEVCRQVAAGVEAAHEAGVVHRDLKPGNVMLRPDGAVKVLDFGLAKGGAAHGASSSDPNLSASPTMTYAGTSAGVILGTAAYMSPEQARGRRGPPNGHLVVRVRALRMPLGKPLFDARRSRI
jgi:serine/threonine-protein kinase